MSSVLGSLAVAAVTLIGVLVLGGPGWAAFGFFVCNYWIVREATRGE